MANEKKWCVYGLRAYHMCGAFTGFMGANRRWYIRTHAPTDVMIYSSRWKKSLNVYFQDFFFGDCTDFKCCLCFINRNTAKILFSSYFHTDSSFRSKQSKCLQKRHGQFVTHLTHAHTKRKKHCNANETMPFTLTSTAETFYYHVQSVTFRYVCFSQFLITSFNFDGALVVFGCFFITCRISDYKQFQMDDH